MLLKNFKYKDLVIAIVAAIFISGIGYKAVENYQYFFNIIAELWSLMVPFIYGLVIAYTLNPLVMLLTNRFKFSSGVAILTTYVLLIGTVVIVVLFLMPSIVESVVQISKSIPDYIKNGQKFGNDILNNPNIKAIISNIGFTDNANSIVTRGGTTLVNLLEGSIGYVFTISGQVVKLFLGLLISVYVLIDKNRFITSAKRFTFLIFKKKKGIKVIEFVRIYHKMICAYIGIKAIDSLVIAILAFILLSIVGSEYPFLLSVIVGVTNMIPYFGPLIGEVIGLLFNVFVSPIKGIVVLLILLAIQIFDGTYLDPKLIGDKVGVRPFTIILAVVIGGGFFGAVGMLLASPTVATINVYYKKMLEKNKSLMIEADEA